MQRHSEIVFFLLLVGSVPLSSIGADEHAHDHSAHSPETAANMPSSNVVPMLVDFPLPLREHTLANMRDHLSVIAEIQADIAAHRYNDAAELAEQRLGMSSLKLHGAHEVAKFMPK